MKMILEILRSIIIYLSAFSIFFIIGPLVLILVVMRPLHASKYIIPFCKLMIWIFRCEIRVYGTFPSNEETFVIMANHASFLDVFAIPAAFSDNKNFSAVAASKNFKIPIYATFLRRMKVVSIDRSNREQAIAGIKKAEKILQEGFHITILPEGTRTANGELGIFKKGGFHLAIDTQAEILPIVTKGLFDIKPRNRWTIKPGVIKVYIGKPITSKNKEVNTLLNEVHNFYIDTLEN